MWVSVPPPPHPFHIECLSLLRTVHDIRIANLISSPNMYRVLAWNFLLEATEESDLEMFPEK